MSELANECFVLRSDYERLGEELEAAQKQLAELTAERALLLQRLGELELARPMSTRCQLCWAPVTGTAQQFFDHMASCTAGREAELLRKVSEK